MASRRARPGPGTTAGVRGVHPPDARDATAQRPPLLRSVSGSLATAARRGHPPPRRTSQDRGLCGHPGRRVGERVRETGGHSRSNSVAPCLAATRRRSSRRSRKADPVVFVYLARASAATSSPRRCRRSRRSSTRAPGPFLPERTIVANTSNLLFAGPRGVDPHREHAGRVLAVRCLGSEPREGLRDGQLAVG